jgi:hypothetical protein
MTIFAIKPQFPPELGSAKRFRASGMRAIDFPHKITPRGAILEKNISFTLRLKNCSLFGKMIKTHFLRVFKVVEPGQNVNVIDFSRLWFKSNLVMSTYVCCKQKFPKFFLR